MGKLMHCWIGHFDSMFASSKFFDEAYPRSDDSPLSKFIESQGETWYDHDMMYMKSYRESENIANVIKEHTSWDSELENKCNDISLTEVNLICMLPTDEVKSPCDAAGDGFQLTYFGKINF